MCEYSLHDVATRPAMISDHLVMTEFGSTRGFAAVGEHGAKLVTDDSPPKVAVCLLPGTELAFDNNVRYEAGFSVFRHARVNHKVARFRQIDVDDPHVQHDALEFPDGQILKLTRLIAGQSATVLQLPVATQHPEHVETGHVTGSSDSRVTLNRVPSSAGMASVLMPNQGAVLLWQAVRSAAHSLTTAWTQAFCRLKAHKQHSMPAAANADIEATFRSDLLALTLPKPVARKPDKKFGLKAAA